MGVDIDVRVEGSRADELVAELAELWSWCPRTGRSRERKQVVATLDDDPATLDAAHAKGAIAGHELEGVAGRVTTALVVEAVEASKGELLMLRAAAVAHPVTGQCVILLGGPGAGKSAAARALGRYFAYVTDETVALTRTLHVLPFPKPLGLVVDGSQPRKAEHSPARLGLQPPPRALRPAAVLLLERHGEGFVPPVLEELPVDQAIAHIAAHTSYLASLERPLHLLADLVHAAGGAHRLSYREADDVVAIVQGFLNRPPSAMTAPAPEEEPTLDDLRVGPAARVGDRVRRRAFTDFYVEDGVGCVMVGGQVVALSLMATRILTLLDHSSATTEELTEVLLTEFGLPDAGDPVALVETQVADLVDVGVLEVAG